jgi:hypothetical protein
MLLRVRPPKCEQCSAASVEVSGTEMLGSSMCHLPPRTETPLCNFHLCASAAYATLQSLCYATFPALVIIDHRSQCAMLEDIVR